jgi:hypothetical protein
MQSDNSSATACSGTDTVYIFLYLKHSESAKLIKGSPAQQLRKRSVSLGVTRLDEKTQVALAFGANAGDWKVEKPLLIVTIIFFAIYFFFPQKKATSAYDSHSTQPWNDPADRKRG